jgi:hypothetical protein
MNWLGRRFGRPEREFLILDLFRDERAEDIYLRALDGVMDSLRNDDPAHAATRDWIRARRAKVDPEGYGVVRASRKPGLVAGITGKLIA